MSYLSVANQPVIFYDPTELDAACDCGVNDFKRLVDYSDGLSFQLDATPCDSPTYSKTEELVTWEYVGETQIIESVAATAGSLTETFYYGNIYHYFKLEVSVIGIQGTLEISLTGSTEPDIIITTAGTYTFYFNTLSLDTQNYLTLSYTSGDFIGMFSRSNLLPIFDTLMLGIVSENDLEDLITYTLPAETQTYFNDGKLTFFDRNYFNEIEGGCYRIGIADPCINTCGVYGINDGLFSYDVLGTYWDIQGAVFSSWNIVQGSGAEWTGTGTSSTACLVNNKNLCNGLSYNITIEITDVDRAYLEVYIDGVMHPTTFNAIGTYSFNIVAPATGTPNVILCAYGTGTGLNLINVSRVIVQLNPDARELTTWNFNRYSDAFSLGDYIDPCKFALVNACLGQDAFNFDTSHPEGFRVLTQRFEYRKFQPQYDSDIESFRYSSGRFRAIYVDIKKKWRFNFGRMPEFLLDFFSVALFSDRLQINSEDYYPAETELPTIIYNDSDSYGEMNVELYKRKEKLLKTFCTDGDC